MTSRRPLGLRARARSAFPPRRPWAQRATRPCLCSTSVPTCQAAFAPAAIMACVGRADVAEPVDAGDLKSPAPRGVRVRLPPSAPALRSGDQALLEGGSRAQLLGQDVAAHALLPGAAVPVERDVDDLARRLEDELVELDLAGGVRVADLPGGADGGEAGGPEIGGVAE